MWTSARAPRPWPRLFAAVTLFALLAPALAALAAYPVLDVNTGLTLNEGATATITNSILRVSMQSTPANSIAYQVTGTPTHGALLRNGVPLILGDSFTQDDINSGRLTYAHDGSETTSDSFAFRAADALRQPMTRVSVASDGTQGNSFSSGGSLSADGRFVAFDSEATNLVSGDTNTKSDVFVQDRQTGQTTRVSVDSNGTQGNNVGNSIRGSLSADGRFVAFDSEATNLVGADTNSASDVFVHDRQTGQTTLVSVDSTGTQGNSFSYDSSLSSDGRFVVFGSLATNLVSSDTDGDNDIYVHDRQTGQTTLVSVDSNGAQSNSESYGGSLSADGRFVAFESYATNLVGADTNNASDVFVHDRQTGQTTRVSVATDGTQGNSFSNGGSLSADGRFVAFQSVATNLISGDTNTKRDIFVHDRQTGQTTRVSVDSNGTQGNDVSPSAESLSADGRFILFKSSATNLVVGDTNGVEDAFLHDWQTGQTTRISVASDGTQGNGAAPFAAALSADGRFVAFQSVATNLVSGDTNTARDVFVADRGIAYSFAIGVIPTNDPPTLSLLADQTAIRDGTPTLISFQVGDGETSPDQLSVTTSSSNPALVPNANVFLGGDGANRSLAVQPLAGQIGQTVITVRVSDGNLTTTRSFTFTVQPPPATAPPWLALLYLAGDDIAPQSPGQTGLTEPLRDLLARLNAMPPNPALRLVVLFDGDQTGDSALYIRQPGAQGLTRVLSPSPWPNFSSELNSGSTATLRNFVTWARLTYPGSPHTMLSIVDHGGGWAPDAGGFGQPRGRLMVSAGGWTGLAIDAQANNGTGASLSTKAIGEALAGLGHFDMLFLDACLMGMLETATEVQPYAGYLVAGENLLWSRLPYEKYLAPSLLTATTAPRSLAQAIVQHYNEPPSTDEPFTIAALDMSKLPNLVTKTNALAQALLAALPPAPVPLTNPARRAIGNAYVAAQKFDYDSSFSLDRTTDAYLDLSDFARRLLLPANAVSGDVTSAAQAVVDTIGGRGEASRVIVSFRANNGTVRTPAGVQTWDFAHAYGVSIYLPLGERDCRPTGRAISDVRFAALAPCVAPATARVGDLQIEPQLSYYVRPEQLRFSGVEGAPAWAALLARMDPTILNRAANQPRIQSPFLATSHKLVYLPLARR
jgi:hypothetical protein